MIGQRTLRVDRTPAEVFAYLADFTHITEWDATTRACERIGDDDVSVDGSLWRAVGDVVGRQRTLEYVAIRLEPPSDDAPGVVMFRGNARDIYATTTFTIDAAKASPGGTALDVRYAVDLGALRNLFAPITSRRRFDAHLAALMVTILDALTA